MSKPLPLAERVIAALSQPIASDTAAAVLADAQAELLALNKRADDADLASLSPLASSAEARTLRQTALDHRFEADRLDAAVQSLMERVDELRDAEERDRHAADKAAVQAVFDHLAADIAAQYPRIVREMTALVKRIEENGAECNRVGIHDSAERVGRGFDLSTAGTPMHSLVGVILPLPADGWGRAAWGYAGPYGATRTWDGLSLAVEAGGE